LAEKGYLGKQLFEELFEDGLELITNLRSKMKNKLIPVGDKLLLGKRLMIETINDQLKNICHIEHSRQRSPVNFRVNLIAGLISDTWKEKKPCIRMPHNALTAW
jgi:hypothetical protein